MTIRIRPANILDAAALVSVQGAASAAAPHSPSDELGWQELLANPGATNTWVAASDEVVGFIHVEAVGPGFPQLVRVNELVAGDSAKTRAALLDYALGDFGAYAEVPAHDSAFWSDHGFSERTRNGDVVVMERGE